MCRHVFSVYLHTFCSCFTLTYIFFIILCLLACLFSFCHFFEQMNQQEKKRKVKRRHHLTSWPNLTLEGLSILIIMIIIVTFWFNSFLFFLFHFISFYSSILFTQSNMTIVRNLLSLIMMTISFVEIISLYFIPECPPLSTKCFDPPLLLSPPPWFSPRSNDFITLLFVMRYNMN